MAFSAEKLTAKLKDKYVTLRHLRSWFFCCLLFCFSPSPEKEKKRIAIEFRPASCFFFGPKWPAPKRKKKHRNCAAFHQKISRKENEWRPYLRSRTHYHAGIFSLVSQNRTFSFLCKTNQKVSKLTSRYSS